MALVPRAAVLLVVLGASFGAETVPRDGSSVERILHRRPEDQRTHEQLAEELVTLGPGLIPTWFGWLTGEGVDAVFLAGDEFRPEDWAVLPEAAPELARHAIVRFSADDVVSYLEQRFRRARPDTQGFLATMDVLEGLGSARGLDLFWTLVEQQGRDVFAQRRVRASVDAALAAMLAGDPDSWRSVAKRLKKPDPIEAELLTEAFRKAGRPEAHALLLDLLAVSETSSERFDVVEGLAVVERLFPWHFDGQAVRALERCWLGLTPADRIAAASVFGRSEDPGAIGLLLEMTESKDSSTRSAAERALESLGNVAYGRDLEAWQRWHERELAWWERESEELFLHLEGTPAEGAAVLDELACHPLFRRRIAQRVAASLPYQEERMLPLSCSFLVALGSRAALPALMEIEGQVQEPELVEQLRVAVATLSGHAFVEGEAARRRVLGY